MIHTFDGKTPELAPDVFVAPGAHVIGDVRIGAGSSVWFNSVVRGDVFHIRIGNNTNIQDLSMVHVTTGKHATILGDNVTVGHRVLLHGCSVADNCLIGMGSTLMDRVVVGEYSIVAAGALVTEGTSVPPGHLAIGAPAQVRRPVNEEERALIDKLALRYRELAMRYFVHSQKPVPK